MEHSIRKLSFLIMKEDLPNISKTTNMNLTSTLKILFFFACCRDSLIPRLGLGVAVWRGVCGKGKGGSPVGLAVPAKSRLSKPPGFSLHLLPSRPFCCPLPVYPLSAWSCFGLLLLLLCLLTVARRRRRAVSGLGPWTPLRVSALQCRTRRIHALVSFPLPVPRAPVASPLSSAW
jgi:hypothetical protein